MLPPLWECAVAAVPLLGLGIVLYRFGVRDELKLLQADGEASLGGVRARAAVASLVFTGAIALGGWLVWLLFELDARAVIFVVLWSVIAIYFLIAAGAFRTQMGRFTPWKQPFWKAMRETAMHLVEALLWGPLTVMVLLRSRRP